MTSPKDMVSSMLSEASKSLMNSLIPAVESENPGENTFILPNGKYCLTSELDFTWMHAKLLRHLEFLQRLNEQQGMNIAPAKLLEMAIQLLSVQTTEETAIGAIYEEQFNAIAYALEEIAKALPKQSEGEAE